MGTWGPGIFSDDTACDIRDEFAELIAQGFSAADATVKLVQEWGMEVPGDSRDDTVFWLALAATQWRLGRLEDSVRERALGIIEFGGDLQHWQAEVGPKEARQRALALGKLKQQILSPTPPARRLKTRYLQETEFRLGDVIRYRLRSGRPILLIVVDHFQDAGGRYPIVEILKPGTDVAGWLKPLLGLRGALDPITGGPRRIAVGRWSKTDYPADRLERVAVGLVVFRLVKFTSARRPEYIIQWWKYFDDFLEHHFGLT